LPSTATKSFDKNPKRCYIFTALEIARFLTLISGVLLARVAQG
jgi:hypothetical protein